MIEVKEIRTAVIDKIIELSQRCSEIVVLDADVSKSTKTRLFGQAFPDRFFNVGVAEMNMASMAAGLATAGKVPFVSSFAVFLAMRALEPIRTMISYPGLNVKMLGGYSGLTAHQHGPTHHCLQDTAIMRSLPNFVILSPSDWVQASKCVEAAFNFNGPAYIRLGYLAEKNIYPLDCDFEIGKNHLLKDGDDITFLTTGVIAPRVLEVANELESVGISAGVIDCPSIKPLDHESILLAAKKTRKIITVEEHSVIGGFGSAVAELLSQKHHVQMKILGVGDVFTESAPYFELLDACGLSKIDIANSAKDLMNNDVVGKLAKETVG